MNKFLLSALKRLSSWQFTAIGLLRVAIAVILIWIGGLKYFNYEAEGIVPFVANSPFMEFFYTHASEYKSHRMKEGEMNQENLNWNRQNNTYRFALGLGLLIVSLGILLLLNPISPATGMIGAALIICMSLTTLSFLITTPEAWVKDMSINYSGFPLLSGAGRLVVKDLIMLAGAFVCLCDSATSFLTLRRFRKI